MSTPTPSAASWRGDTAQPGTSRLYLGWLLFVLLLVCLVNYADRSVVAAVAEPMRRDLGLTDTQLGWLQGLSFALLYSVLGIPFARLAEARSRVRIIAAATFVWSLMTALCGAAAGYLQLLAVRVGVGVGEAGFMAPATSLLGDHFRRDQRAMASSIMMLGVPCGALIGAMSGGMIAQSLGWRWAFVIMGAPGLLVALLVLLTLREPVRGLADETQDQDVPSLEAVAERCFGDPTFRHVLMGGILGGFGLHGLGQFLNVYFVRVHHLSYREAGAIYGLQSFISIGLGLMAGGLLATHLGRKNPRWYSLVPAAGLLLSVPIYLLAFQSMDLTTSVVLIILAGTSLLLHYGPSLALVQNLATPQTRASTMAIYMLFVNVIAQGFGAPVVGALSDLFAGSAAGLTGAACGPGSVCAQAQATGLRHALMASTVLYAWGGIHYLLAQRRRGAPTDQPARTDMETPGAPG
jgi:predicted MFS family arabinose efflux permease